MKRSHAVAAALASLAFLALPSTAFAAGSGYTPPGATGPVPGGVATGLAGTVITSTTIQPSGGTASATIGGATIDAVVKVGTFTNPVQVVLTDAQSSSVTPSAGSKEVVTFGIGVYENGTKVTGTFPAITVTVTSPSITAGSSVYLVVGSTLKTVSGASVTAGSAKFVITSDPTVEVVAPVSASGTGSSSSAIAGATSGQTGEPFLLEGGVAGGLVIIGGILLAGLFLRRRSA